MKLYSSIIISILVASTSLATPLSVKDVLKLTLENNLEKQSQEDQLTLFKNTHTLAESGLLPTLEASTAISKTTGKSSATLSDDTNFSNANSSLNSNSSSLTLTETLPHLLAPFHKAKQLNQSTQLEQFKFKAFTENLVLDTLQTTYSVIQYQKIQRLAQELLSESQSHLEKISAQHRVGASTPIELLSAKHDVLKNTQQNQHIQQQHQQQKLKLNKLTGTPLTSPLDLVDSFMLASPLKLKKLLQTAKKQNTAIQIASQKKDLTNTEATLIKDSLLPSISTAIGYVNTNSSDTGGYLKSTETKGIQATAAITWTLFDSGKRLNKLKSIPTSKRYVEKREKIITQEVLFQLRSLHLEYSTLLTNLSLLVDGISITKQQLNEAQFLFSSGQLSISELYQYKVTAIKTQEEHILTQLKVKKLETHLLTLSGKLSMVY